MIYSITAKGRSVLRSATMWGLSRHLRELLALCDPQVRLDQARQFIPPESLQIAVFSLQQLELIEGPPAKAPRSPDRAVGGWRRREVAVTADGDTVASAS